MEKKDKNKPYINDIFPLIYIVYLLSLFIQYTDAFLPLSNFHRRIIYPSSLASPSSLCNHLITSLDLSINVNVLKETPHFASHNSTNGCASSIYIGNIDWNIPPNKIKQIIQTQINHASASSSTNSSKDYKSHDQHLLTKDQIWIKDKTNKKRDEHKLHGGSLILTSFTSKEEAEYVMQIISNEEVQSRLTTFLNPSLSVDKGDFIRIRWSTSMNLERSIHTQKKNISKKVIRGGEEEKEEVVDDNGVSIENDTDEQKLIEHRKNRALKYQRQRRRIAARTDAIINYIHPRFIPSSSSSLLSIDTLNMISLSHSSPIEMESSSKSTESSSSSSSSSLFKIDWSTVPKEIDPMRGGKLRQNSNRGFRKQAQVEAFVYVLQNALLSSSEDTCTSKSSLGRGKRLRIADLGCGGGNLSLPLAWFLRRRHPNDNNNVVMNPSSRSSSMKSEDVQIVAIDINSHALKRLDKRANDIGLDIETVQEDLLNLISSTKNTSSGSGSSSTTATNSVLESCSAVVSLHACGAASDLAIHAAVSHSLPFAISPCCIGKVKSIRRDMNHLPSMASLSSSSSSSSTLSSSQRSGTPSDGTISYPRSESLATILKEYDNCSNEEGGQGGEIMDEYSLLLAAADYSMSDGFVQYNDVSSDNDESASSSSSSSIIDQTNANLEYISKMSKEDQAFHKRGKMAKLIVETDRLKWAEEQGYYTRIMELPKLGATYPKRELLLGAKLGTMAAKRISRLPSSSTRLWSKSSDNDDDTFEANDSVDSAMSEVVEKDVEDRMDLGGFANYLAPYALALLGSIAVTAAFFKFVLMDY